MRLSSTLIPFGGFYVENQDGSTKHYTALTIYAAQSQFNIRRRLSIPSFLLIPILICLIVLEYTGQRPLLAERGC
jgi:hypothetical protein